MLNQFCHLDYSDNRLKLGLDYDSLTWYGWMSTYLFIFLKFVGLLPQSTLCTTGSARTSLYETLGWMSFQCSLEFKGKMNAEFKEEKRASQRHWES